jgi:hypothetical protein
VKVQELTAGTVLDDRDLGVREIIREAYENCPVNKPGMYQKVREIDHVTVKTKYVYIVLACLSIVRRPKDFEVEIL